MSEIIRYSWGTTTLGDLLVAVSDNGIVAVDFGSEHAPVEQALRERLAPAELREAAEELAALLHKVIEAVEHPGFDPQLPLDLRGTPYEVTVWSMLPAIPPGETTNYGALASRLGTRDAREVTAAIAGNPIAVLVPCHRVIKKDGSLSGYRWGFKRKRELLLREQRAATLPSGPLFAAAPPQANDRVIAGTPS